MILRNRLSLLFFILISNAAFTQDTARYFHLNSVELTIDESDLSRLDHYFEKVTLVGMGESSHGTHEFSTIRLRFFKYLVEKHQFNTLFLEAGYANCLGINNYINSTIPINNSLARKVVFENGVWPWTTYEMVAVVNWMKQFNLDNPLRNLSFIGVDVQSYRYTLNQLDELLKKYQLPVTDSILINQHTEKSRALILAELQSMDLLGFAAYDLTVFNELVHQLGLTMEYLNNTKPHLYRDTKMGENMIRYISKDSDRKGFYWAHNSHVSGYSFKAKKWKGGAGGFLKDKMGDQYFSIGQEFYKGTFNANLPRHQIDESQKKSKMFYLTKVTVSASKEKSFANYYSHLKSPVFIEQNFIPSEISSGKFFLMNSIGAVYLGDKMGSNYRYNLINKNSFDAIILINESTPTNLLNW